MSVKTNLPVYQVANTVAVVAALIFNMLANILPFNGVTTGQVSNSYPNLFTPPGYVFSIWGVIYVQAIVFMIYQARSSQRKETYLARIGFFYLIAAVANLSWLLLFHYSYSMPQLFITTLIPMTVLLVCLLSIYQRLSIGRSAVSRNQKLAVHLHISVYLGWISLAIIANVASVLNVLIPGISESIQALWAAILITIVLIVGSLMVFNRRDLAFGFVVIWASIGIALNRVTMPLIFTTSILAIVVIVVLMLLAPFLKRTEFVDYYSK